MVERVMVLMFATLFASVDGLSLPLPLRTLHFLLRFFFFLAAALPRREGHEDEREEDLPPGPGDGRGELEADEEELEATDEGEAAGGVALIHGLTIPLPPRTLHFPRKIVC